MADTFSLNVGQGIRSETGAWYRNVQVLGQGANAITFLALSTEGPHDGVLFAIKVFRRISDDARRQAFLNEVGFLSAITHPSILRVYDAGIFRRYYRGDPEEFPFVAAEYLPRTLADVIRGGQATIVEKVSYALQLLAALVFLSSRDPAVIHRDIKPANIFVKGGSCVLGDFGLMKFENVPDDLDRQILKESELPGMPFYYRTPDLIAYGRKEASITTRTDVFQLGLVLAELFTGWNPAKRPQADILEPLELEPLRNIPGELGAGIAALIRRMLVTDPAQREAASDLMDGWEGVMSEAVNRAHALEGRAFP